MLSGLVGFGQGAGSPQPWPSGNFQRASASPPRQRERLQSDGDGGCRFLIAQHRGHIPAPASDPDWPNGRRHLMVKSPDWDMGGANLTTGGILDCAVKDTIANKVAVCTHVRYLM